MLVARRQLETTWAQKEGNVIVLALDWAKAIDSVSPRALTEALQRFGHPNDIVQMITVIYQDYHFVAKNAGAKPGRHRQEFDISRGCLLSPYLLVMGMTVLIGDAKVELAQDGVAAHQGCLVNELV